MYKQQHIKSTLANGREIEYKESESTGIFYHQSTPDEIVKILDWARNNNVRLKFAWGNIETGEDWGETYDIAGTIGKSTGTIKIPLLIKTRRSWGGGGLLDNCIVKISYANKREGGVIYQHPKYHIKGEV